ncbi:MAG: NAD-dependent epimerase/dehydratase family protein [Bacteroidales bacterium]|nr:NAD-dependent epimerase/dehydratase family protein [Bacteroidales bacterium]
MIAITGSTGFVGSHLLLDFCRQNKEFIAIKRENSDIRYTLKIFEINDALNLFDKIKWLNCDLTNYLDVYEKLKGVSVLIHAAAVVSLTSNSNSLIKNNVEITKNIVNACTQHNVKLVHISSIATLAMKNNIGKEEYKINPNDFHSKYTLSKYFSELEVWKGMEEGLQAIILHPSVIIGYLKNERLMTRLYKYFRKRYIYIPDIIVSIVDVKDVIKAINIIIDKDLFDNENFIITAYNIKLQEIVRLINQKFKVNSKIKIVNVDKFKMLFKIGDIFSRVFRLNILNSNMLNLLKKNYIYDNSKFIKKVNFIYTPLEQTLEDVIIKYEKINKT